MSSADITMTNNYWNMLRNLNDEVKLRLASMLTASVVEHRDKSVSEKDGLTEAMIKKYAGAWEDDYGYRKCKSFRETELN